MTKFLPPELQRVVFDTARQEIADKLSGERIDQKAQLILEHVGNFRRQPDDLTIIHRRPIYEDEEVGEQYVLNRVASWNYEVGFERISGIQTSRWYVPLVKAEGNDRYIYEPPAPITIEEAIVVSRCIHDLAKLRHREVPSLQPDLVDWIPMG